MKTPPGLNEPGTVQIKNVPFDRQQWYRLVNDNANRQNSAFRLKLGENIFYILYGQIDYLTNNWNSFIGKNIELLQIPLLIYANGEPEYIHTMLDVIRHRETAPRGRSRSRNRERLIT